jgi:hypothetical protein
LNQVLGGFADFGSFSKTKNMAQFPTSFAPTLNKLDKTLGWLPFAGDFRAGRAPVADQF